MLRKAFLFAALCLAGITASSQRNYLGLSFGASFPSEEFAKTSLEEDGGYAMKGFALEFSGAYIFDYYFGITGALSFSSNQPDTEKLTADLVAGIEEPLPPDAEVIFNSGPWMYTNVMAGPILTLPVWKLNFDLRAIAGLSFLISPPFELTVNTEDETYFQSFGGNTVNFAYMLGTAIRFNMNQNYAIRLSADYFHSKPSFEVNEESLVGSATEKSSYDMSVGTLNVSIGIAYRF